jgi:hypothetical protein
MLRNRYYTGWVRYSDEWYPGEHEAIISQELFDEAQRVRARRGHGAAHGVKTGTVYLLHRVGRCWHCGRYLHMVRSAKPQGTYYYYREPSTNLDRDCETAGSHTSMHIIDRQVSALITRLQLPDDWRERLEELNKHQEKRDDVQGKQRYLEERRRRLRDLYELGDYTLSEYKRKRDALTRRIDALCVPDAPEVEQAGETLESLGAEWANAPKRYQRDMLRVIFDGIFIDIPNRRLVCVKPYPPFVPLFRMDGLTEKEGCFYVSEEEEKA